MRETILELSTNNHTLRHEKEILVKELDQLSGKQVKISEDDNVKIVHGEHHLLGIEKPHLIKVNQQEYNPILNLMQNASD